MRVGIVQSSYIPWRGYFDLISRCDRFVLFDTVQFTRRDWRNRNRIKTDQGLAWLTIPVRSKGRYDQRICDTILDGNRWARTHWSTVQHAYRKSAAFEAFRAGFADLYEQAARESHLSAVNRLFTKAICGWLGISTEIHEATDYQEASGRNERLISICLEAGATRYLSGPSARDYIDEDLFNSQGIEVEWMDYAGYLEYPQLHGPFEPQVSIIDLILNTGEAASRFLGPGGDREQHEML